MPQDIRTQYNLQNYIGNWFESKKHSQDRNPNNIEIIKVTDNKVKFRFYITRVADFDETEIIINNNYGTFYATAFDGENEAQGSLEFLKDKIKLTITKTDVKYLEPGSTYTFTYKK